MSSFATTRLCLKKALDAKCLLSRRSFATGSLTLRASKKEGDISSVFASLSGDSELGFGLPARFADLKQSLVNDDAHVVALTKAWHDVLGTLKSATAEIAERPERVIPEIEYPSDSSVASGPLEGWLSKKQLADIKHRGVSIIKGVVPEQEALQWKAQVQEYAHANPQIRGFPADNKQVFEMYWSKPQIAARSHPHLLNTSRAFLQLFRAPHQDANLDMSADIAISLSDPIVYADRLRIRHPGDNKFALGPHIDGGGVERWEDKPFRHFYNNIIEGSCDWRKHDGWSLGDNGERLAANGSVYEGAGQCSVFRPLQGWLSMSETRRNEGTLRVLPLLHEATAYIMLRPFFKPKKAEKPANRKDPQYSEAFLEANNWVFDASTPDFPGCSLGHNIELNTVTHPHLHLDKTMTSIPLVKPGDMVFWHTDLVHAVETEHRGQGDSSVMYIPAIPLTSGNAAYLFQQRDAFVQGVPPPDFPGGEGEKTCSGRAGAADVKGAEARRAMGFEKFAVLDGISSLQKGLLDRVNAQI